MKLDIGVEVICIDDSIKPEALIELSNDVPNWVVRGRKYIVRDIMYNDNIATGILLEEVVNPKKYFHLLGRVQEPAFAQWRFAFSKEKQEEIKEEETILETVN
jgi:hypothetical protein